MLSAKQEQRECPYCGTTFVTYRTRRKVTCGNPDCSRRARAEASRRSTQARWDSGLFVPLSERPDVRARISAGVKRAYAEGRLTSASKRPEVRAKIAEAQRRFNSARSPEARRKISETLRIKYRTGQLKRAPLTPEGRARVVATHSHPLSEQRRQRVSEGLKRAWAEGRMRREYGPNSSVSPVERILMPYLEPLGFENNKRVGIRFKPDFVHRALRIIVEIDGDHHREMVRIRKRDDAAEKEWRASGYKILRVDSAAALRSPHAVIQKIVALIGP